MEGEDQTKGISGVIALQRPPFYNSCMTTCIHVRHVNCVIWLLFILAAEPNKGNSNRLEDI